jgi:hypothetical protein
MVRETKKVKESVTEMVRETEMRETEKKKRYRW